MTGMPAASRTERGPMPERWRSNGEPTGPAETMTAERA